MHPLLRAAGVLFDVAKGADLDEEIRAVPSEHRVTVKTGLPSKTWREVYGAKSMLNERMRHLEACEEVDRKLAGLSTQELLDREALPDMHARAGITGVVDLGLQTIETREGAVYQAYVALVNGRHVEIDRREADTQRTPLKQLFIEHYLRLPPEEPPTPVATVGERRPPYFEAAVMTAIGTALLAGLVWGLVLLARSW